MKAFLLLVNSLVFSLPWQTATCIPLPEFFPFGPDFGDTELDQGDNIRRTVDLEQAITYLGENRQQIIVCLTVVVCVCVHVHIYIYC